jgi:hypothetical protein
MSQVIGRSGRRPPHLKDLGWDTALPDQGCHISQEKGVIDEYETIVERWSAVEIRGNKDKNLSLSPNFIPFSRLRLWRLSVFPCGFPDLGPPLWPSDQSVCLQIQRLRIRFPAYQIFWEVGGLERGPLSLVKTTEELLEWKSSGSGLENRD